MTDTICSGLSQLGRAIDLPASPETAELERVQNPQADTAYCVRFVASEFTSLSR